MEHLTSLISAYSVIILLPIMIVEGPIVTVMAAFLASLGVISVVEVYFLAVLGNMIGDVGYYTFGRFLGKRGVEQRSHFMGLHKGDIDIIEERYRSHLFATIAVAKITEAPVMPVLVTAGVLKANVKKFLLTALSIELPKVLVLVSLGYFFGEYYQTIGVYLRDFVAVSAITCFVLLLWYIRRRRANIKKI